MIDSVHVDCDVMEVEPNNYKLLFWVEDILGNLIISNAVALLTPLQNGCHDFCSLAL